MVQRNPEKVQEPQQEPLCWKRIHRSFQGMTEHKDGFS